MKAVILVGGEGTRLRPLTYNTVKAMVPVLNRPFLEHMFSHLSKNHITDIILTLCYLPDCIQSYFGDGSKFGVKLTYVMEKSPLGTAGAVRNAANYLRESFVVCNGDVYTDLDLTAMLTYHRENKSTATIALTPVDNPTLYGVVETDSRGRVRQFVEKPSWDRVTTNMINAGIYILEPEVLNSIPSDAPYMFERGLFPLLVERKEPVCAFPSSAYWIDMGTPEKYLQLHRDLLWQRKKQSQGQEVWTEGKSFVHPSARITGPVLIGEGCHIEQGVRLEGPSVLGPGCSLGRGVVHQGSILWRNVRTGQGAILRNSIVADNSFIGENSVIEDSILSHNVTVTRGCRLEPGTKLEPGTRWSSAPV